jgi:hypothetical protein
MAKVRIRRATTKRASRKARVPTWRRKNQPSEGRCGRGRTDRWLRYGLHWPVAARLTGRAAGETLQGDDESANGQTQKRDEERQLEDGLVQAYAAASALVWRAEGMRREPVRHATSRSCRSWRRNRPVCLLRRVHACVHPCRHARWKAGRCLGSRGLRSPEWIRMNGNGRRRTAGTKGTLGGQAGNRREGSDQRSTFRCNGFRGLPAEGEARYRT